jgi:hypothetical protein
MLTCAPCIISPATILLALIIIRVSINCTMWLLDFCMKIAALDETYNFLVTGFPFDDVKVLKKKLHRKYSTTIIIACFRLPH